MSDFVMSIQRGLQIDHKHCHHSLKWKKIFDITISNKRTLQNYEGDYDIPTYLHARTRLP